LATVGICASAFAYAAVNCPIENFSMYFTGKTRTEMGKLLYEYKCPNGHVTWIVQ
jgi:hypothetical protein